MWRVQVVVVALTLLFACFITTPYANVSKAGSMDGRCMPYVVAPPASAPDTAEARACADYTGGKMSAQAAVNAHFPVTMPWYVVVMAVVACALVVVGLGSFPVAVFGAFLMLAAFLANVLSARAQM
jgi:uncharacterized membrane protein YphA (DoxX/SURF4 family)